MNTLPRIAVRADRRSQGALLMGFFHQKCVRPVISDKNEAGKLEKSSLRQDREG